MTPIPTPETEAGEKYLATLAANLAPTVEVPDPLTARYIVLADKHELPSVEEYAKAWETLAADCKAAGRPSLAVACLSRADFYRKQTPGVYIRLIEGSFSELIMVEPL